MKNFAKVLTALAAVAGAIYIIATYGEQIVTWAKKLWNAMPKCPNCEEAEVVQEFVEETAPQTAEEAPVEEPAAEEVPAPEVAEEESAPEIVVAEHEPVAEEADFAE